MSETNKCPVCMQADLGDFEICPNCEWQNDHYQFAHPDVGYCCNIMSLNEARKAYKQGKKIV